MVLFISGSMYNVEIVKQLYFNWYVQLSRWLSGYIIIILWCQSPGVRFPDLAKYYMLAFRFVVVVVVEAVSRFLWQNIICPAMLSFFLHCFFNLISQNILQKLQPIIRVLRYGHLSMYLSFIEMFAIRHVRF